MRRSQVRILPGPYEGGRCFYAAATRPEEKNAARIANGALEVGRLSQKPKQASSTTFIGRPRHPFSPSTVPR